jgi:cullin 3
MGPTHRQDKVYTPSTKPPSPPTYSLGLSLFLSQVLEHPSLAVGRHLVAALLTLIRLEREGEVVNRSAILSATDMLAGLRRGGAADEGEPVYRDIFEEVFLEETRDFYRREVASALATLSAPEFLAKVRYRFLYVIMFEAKL